MNFSFRSLGSLLIAATVITLNVSAQDAVPSTKELAKSLAAGIQDGSSLVRMKMQTPSKTVLQLQVKSRRTSSNTELVYQVLWPKARKGEGFLLKKSGSRAASGTLLVMPAMDVSLSMVSMVIDARCVVAYRLPESLGAIQQATNERETRAFNILNNKRFTGLL